jgi:UDPglucose 6-dehydrogenase
MRVGIVGYGVIGKATASIFPEIVVYDPLKGYPDPSPLGACDVIFICVPTPTVGGRQDISIVEQALEWTAPFLRPEQVVAIRSTVLPGTTQRLQERHPQLGLAHNPEFLRSHRAMEDAREPHRIVLGADLPHVRRALVDVYRESMVADLERRLILTDATTAELIKYAANCYLAMKISYFNEMYDVGRALNADYETLSTALGMDPRIASGEETRINPSNRGFDDECLPKDLDAFIGFLQERGFPATMFHGTLEVNQTVREDPSMPLLEPEA